MVKSINICDLVDQYGYFDFLIIKFHSKRDETTTKLKTIAQKPRILEIQIYLQDIKKQTKLWLSENFGENPIQRWSVD